ncbi:MAG: SGNH/GDSL hydrolase family protein, partial [Bacteroidales bacterium]|nr:SGNH/GDSL hydrolase family protein [Bacteroidales bacterium]
LQMARNIRQFKGKEASLTAGRTVGGETVFLDPEGDAMERDFKDFSGKGRYVDRSARNDIVSVAVSHDGTSVRFRITTADKVSKYRKGDPTWMNILVRTTLGEGKDFPYDYIIGRERTSGKASVERLAASGTSSAGEAKYKVHGKEMVVEVPLETLDLTPGYVHFFFKVADHITRPDDMMDYYVSGDSAPIGRLDYEYGRKNVLYSRMLDDGLPFNEYVPMDKAKFEASDEGMVVKGASGQVKLDRYYSLGERTVRCEVTFSPDAKAFFRTDTGDFGLYVDVPGKSISIGTVAAHESCRTEVPFLDASHTYIVEVAHEYLKNSARITDKVTGKCSELFLESDGPGGYGKGALQEGFSAGSMWDYYCFGLYGGSSMTVRKVDLASVDEDVFLLIYGDSITQPDGYFPKKDFPQAWTMQIMSNVRGKAVCSGRGGCTINEVLARIPNELPFIRPRYVMVTIGTNGGNTEENLSRLVEYIFSQGAIPILNNIPCNESGTQVEANKLIARVREKYKLQGCLFDLATSVAGDGLEVDKSMMFWENYPPEIFGGWQVWHHPNSKGGTAMYLRSRQDVPELY